MKKKDTVPSKVFSAIVFNLSEAITMNAYCNREIIFRRKEQIKPQLKEQFRALCAPCALVSHEFLFGDDVAKSMKDV